MLGVEWREEEGEERATVQGEQARVWCCPGQQEPLSTLDRPRREDGDPEGEVGGSKDKFCLLHSCARERPWK